MLELLRLNKGFKNPERWVDYALLHKFRRVEAEKLEACPDCRERRSCLIGQYIYYSTLVELRSCGNCGLIFSDVRIDPKVIHGHFEQAYKNEEYFTQQRKDIFEQIADLVSSSACLGSSVLDIGGAKGHLLAIVKNRRPDLKYVLNDLSETACEYAKTRYGFESVCGGVKTLEGLSRRFDVVILSDVIYYEPELNRLWALLSRIVSESGVVIIRVPNRVALIKLGSIFRNLFETPTIREIRDRVWFLNPEHLYVLSRWYLFKRLREIGFSAVKAVPSALLESSGRTRFVLYYCLARAFFYVTFGKAILTPSMIVVARRQY